MQDPDQYLNPDEPIVISAFGEVVRAYEQLSLDDLYETFLDRDATSVTMTPEVHID